MTTWMTPGAAKLNLTLEVLGKRDDGFHDLTSVAISLDLADEIRLTRTAAGRSIVYRDDNGRRVSIETTDDIIDRVWSALERCCPISGGASVEVTKRIPITGGLGGGSADAAAFLRLARLAWDLPLSDDDLRQIGADIGSDVPVCALGGVVRMAGRGELVTPITLPDSKSQAWCVLLYRPEIPVPAAKTATMYRSLRSSDFLSGDATEALLTSLSNGNPPTQADCVNSFDRPAREVMQGLTAAWRAMGASIARASLEHGTEPVTPLLAGAGPTLFAILPPHVAELVAAQLRKRIGFTHVARLLPRDRATTIRVV